VIVREVIRFLLSGRACRVDSRENACLGRDKWISRYRIGVIRLFHEEFRSRSSWSQRVIDEGWVYTGEMVGH
jgi:hypothetical protein